MTEAVETIENSGATPLEVWIEPWAEGLTLPPGGRLTMSGVSEFPGGFEVDRTTARVIVYAWAGSTTVVRDGDKIIRTYDIPVPAIPAGMSMKGFVDLMFDEGSANMTSPVPRKPWWRFW